MRLKAIYTWRGRLAALPVMFSIVCFWGECEDDMVVWPLGLLLFGLGWALRMWAQKYLGYRFITAAPLLKEFIVAPFLE